MTDVAVACKCGEVHAKLSGVSPDTVNRLLCYCDDCQAWFHHLKVAEQLDDHGGCDIVQMAPSMFRFDKGTSHVRGKRLSAKGLHRWYAECCQTPIANTFSPGVPFIGVNTFVIDGNADDSVGKPRAKILGKFATNGAPEGSLGLNVPFLARAMGSVLKWKLGGRTWPHPFYDQKTKAPTYDLATIASEEREALRKLCGPNPAPAQSPT